MVKDTGLRHESNEEYSRTYSPGLVWALRQLHQNGSEAIKGIIGEVIDHLPEADICPGRTEIGVMPYGKSG